MQVSFNKQIDINTQFEKMVFHLLESEYNSKFLSRMI